MNNKPITPYDFLLLRHPVHLTGSDATQGLAYEVAVWENDRFRRTVVLLVNGRELRFSYPDADCVMPLLSPDCTKLAFFVQDAAGARLALYDIAAAELHIVPEHTDVLQIAWQPDSRGLCLACGEDPAKLYLYDLTGGTDTLLCELPGSVRKPNFSPDGTKLAYINMGDSFRLYCLHLKTGETVCLSQDVFQPVKQSLPMFTADNSRVICAGLSMSAGNEQHRVFCLDTAGGGELCLHHTGEIPMEVMPLYADGESLPSSSDYLCAEGNDYFLTIGVRNGRTGIYRFALVNSTVTWARLYEDRRCIAGLSTAGGRISALMSTQQVPFEVYTLTEDGTPLQLSHENNWVNDRTLYPAECLRHVNDGESGWGILRSGEGNPVVLLIHGGPACYFTGGFSLEQQLLAGAGYDVIFANPHGSSGYGEDYADIRKAFDGTAEQDVMSLLHDAAEHDPGMDMSRLGVMGGSYGGFLSAWLIGKHPDFKAACVLRAFLGGEEMKNMLGFSEAEMQRIAAGVNIPVLVMHGEKDTTCPYTYAPDYYKALGTSQKRFVSFPKAKHCVGELDAADAVIFYTEILNWWRDHL